MEVHFSAIRNTCFVNQESYYGDNYELNFNESYIFIQNNNQYIGIKTT